MKNTFKKTLVLFLVGISIVAAAHGQKKDNKPEIFSSNGVALEGYDVVAFKKEGVATKGSPAFKTDYKKVEWHFANRSNLDAFIDAPEKFVPKYGGYCAYGMAEGYKAPIKIETWDVLDGELYFNYNQSIKKKWLQDSTALIEKADKNWKDLEANNK